MSFCDSIMSFCDSIGLFLTLIKTQIIEYFWDKTLDYNTELDIVLKRFNKIKNVEVSRKSKDIGTLFRKNEKKNAARFSLDNLNGIIKIDVKNKTVDVGSKTRYYDVLNETLKYNLMPKIIPELSSITVGGAITGISIESSSFKYGWGHDSVIDMDVLVSSGEVLFCTNNNENKDLFNSIPNSYGVFGYITRVKLELIEAKKFVNVINHKFTNNKEAFEFMKTIAENKKDRDGEDVDFMDAVCFNKDKIYVITGKLSNVANKKPSNYPYNEIYYETIRKYKSDTFTLYDYYWRWDADMFWGVTDVSFLTNMWVRNIFGRYLLNSRMLRALQKIIKSFKKTSKTEHIVQDLGIPYKNASLYYEWICNEIKIYPLWICPVVPKKSNTKFWSYNDNKLYFDIGVFGNVEKFYDDEEFYYNKIIERKLLDLSGNKCFYSGTYLSREQFNTLIDNDVYNIIKNKYDCNNRFGDLYKKIIHS